MNRKNDRAIDAFIRHKAERGLKSSGKRAFVVDFFIRANRHFTVEDLYNAVKARRPGISYSTVYRALRLLTECGIAAESMFGESVTRYEPIERSGHHDHLICRKCGRIIEFENLEIEKLQQRVARKYRFTVTAHRLELYGVCRECQRPARRR
ncbi:transcriptional repressor [candidate division WOR-3 bacterium]|nr:transcriptional repressor [candidate division WOR-3 bacterium]